MIEKIKKWFGHSETIFLARLQVILGVAGMILFHLVNDPNVSGAVQSVLKPEYVPYYVIAVGIITELLRRRGATDLQ